MSLIFYNIRNSDNLLLTDLTKLKRIRNYCFKLNSTHCTQMNDRYFLYGGKLKTARLKLTTVPRSLEKVTGYNKCLENVFWFLQKNILVLLYFGFWLSLSFCVKISRFAQLNYNFTTTVKFD